MVEGEVTLLDARSGDIVEDLRLGRTPRSGAFEVTRMADPDRIDPVTGEPQGEGFVSAVVLGMTPTRLPHGTTSVVELTVGARAADGEGEEVTGRLLWRDGLVGQGQPVNNRVAIEGENRGLSRCQELPIRFTTVASGPFVRCDADGELDECPGAGDPCRP